MESMNYSIKNNALILSRSQVTSDSETQNSVYSYGGKHGENCKNVQEDFNQKVMSIRFHLFTPLSFIKTGDFTGTCLLTAWFDYDGGKTMHASVDLAIKSLPHLLKMDFKQRTTLLNISASPYHRRIILKKCGELITANRFHRNRLILQMTHGQFLKQKRLL